MNHHFQMLLDNGMNVKYKFEVENKKARYTVCVVSLLGKPSLLIGAALLYCIMLLKDYSMHMVLLRGKNSHKAT